MQEQEFFTVAEVAKMLKLSRDAVSRRFENEPGIIDLGAPERLHKRRYRVLRIPAAVLNRFLYKKRVAWFSDESQRKVLRLRPQEDDQELTADLLPWNRALSMHARPLPDFRDAHTPIRLPTDWDSIQPRSRIQSWPESVAAPLVRADARNIEVLTDFQPVNAISDLAVLARLLDSRAKVCVPQRDAALVAAWGIHNPTRWNGTVGFDPVATPPPVGGRRVGDLLAVAV